MEYKVIDKMGREQVLDFITEQWYTTKMAVHGEVFDLAYADGFYAISGDAIVGVVTYTIKGEVCEILSLDSLISGQGVGSQLIKMVAKVAREQHCTVLTTTTTNDNIDAIEFYQKHGFNMTKFSPDAVDASRQLKPEIPLFGCLGIAIRHELEFTFYLPRA